MSSTRTRLHPTLCSKQSLGEWSYVKDGSDYKAAPLPPLPHSTEKRRSERNLHRRVQDFSPSVCFVWYSSNTLSNARGSVIVYTVEAGQVNTWFAAFHWDTQWRLQATKGANREYVQRLCATRS